MKCFPKQLGGKRIKLTSPGLRLKVGAGDRVGYCLTIAIGAGWAAVVAVLGFPAGALLSLLAFALGLRKPGPVALGLFVTGAFAR